MFGNSLAWAEMKITFAKMVWHFDIELAENNVRDWYGEQRVFVLHEALALNVRIRAIA